MYISKLNVHWTVVEVIINNSESGPGPWSCESVDPVEQKNGQMVDVRCLHLDIQLA